MRVQRSLPDWFSSRLQLLFESPISEDSAAVQSELEELDRFVTRSSGLLKGIRNARLDSLDRSTKDQAVGLLRRYPNAFGLAVVRSFSHDGYVREEAVKNLVSIGERSLPYLLLRTCDWVAPVARLAMVAVPKLLPLATTETLRICMSVLPVFERQRQLDQGAALLLIQEVQRRPGLMQELGWKLPGQAVLILIDRGLLDDGEDPTGAMKRGLTHRDPLVVRQSLLRLRKLSRRVQKTLAPSLACSPDRTARMLALQIAEDFQLAEDIRQFLDDRNWLVRSSARIAVKKHGAYDFVKHYRQRLPSPSAVAGLGEVATDSELGELIPFLSHSSRQVRFEAIRALQLRNASEAAPGIRACLWDPRTPIVRAALEALKALHVSVEADELKELLLASRDPAMRRVLEGALDNMVRWDAIRTVIELAGGEYLVRDPDRFVFGWLSRAKRGCAGPTAEQLKRARTALGQTEYVLSTKALQALRSEFEYWSSRVGLA